jgi:sporulation integral membrane protein ytvI
LKIFVDVIIKIIVNKSRILFRLFTYNEYSWRKLMVWNISYWSKVIQRILYVVLLLLGLYLGIKLSIFYMPFLVALIISLMLEPAIKFIMKKAKFTRRTSSIIIFTIASITILGILAWLIITIFAEASSLLQTLNNYFDKIYEQFNNIIANMNFDKLHISEEILSVIENSTNDILQNVSNWIRTGLMGLIDVVTQLPSITICIGITVIALYFICVDKIYILDQIEYHMPKSWVKKITIHLKDLVQTLGGYLKAEATLILVSFIISLVGLYILKFTGFNVQYPLLMALVIGFVDALPILGSGSFMIPWAIICAINGDINLGIAIIILLIIMSISRQVLEPKLVSKNIGVHPIFTLIAMYTGFKIIGILGLLIGPIVLIIFKNIFANLIDRGVFKTIFDKK